ncbi:hypothetical protein NDU88_010242 [Pleurodeles waltl]|uniref:Uncharacterized protein n=1 Tax=Pleurodeles waltl TaxID=8319 RepID=A0AAV7S2Q5_PLEWA|nr:hypothetical protein NDU88_010242 [Pleurodeles waltl]
MRGMGPEMRCVVVVPGPVKCDAVALRGDVSYSGGSDGLFWIRMLGCEEGLSILSLARYLGRLGNHPSATRLRGNAFFIPLGILSAEMLLQE